MDGHNLVAVYVSRRDAEPVRDRLIEFGIPATDIRLSSADADASPASAHTGAASHERHESFWDWLFGSDVPEHDRGWYHANLREGRTALSVLIRNNTERERVADILEEFNPVHMDDGTETGTAPVSMGAEKGEYAPAGSSQMRAAAPELTKEGEQVIPVVKEELAVGKQARERHYRIRTYVVETPIEQQVSLRDERVIVERRPASGTVRSDADALREREFDVVERREEPVVEKRVRPVEEVVIHREANERLETVRDTVRETKVDVDKGPAERRVDVAGTAPSNGKP
ncbi:MAG: YsnF/AvaK domain-containing protein [Stellaceae bacterium]